MRFLPGFLLALFVASLTVSCRAEVQVARADVQRQDASPDADIATLVEGNTAFAFDLYHQLAAEQDGNLIFSPYSISLAFAMVYAGARGDTASQMAETLHFTLPQEQLHPAFNALDLALQPPEGGQPAPTPSGGFPDDVSADDLTLNIANAVWSQEGFSFEESYLETLGLNYGAGLNLADFSANPEGARQIMRQWVEDATEGNIRDVPPPDVITPQTRLALLNAIYFKGEWTWPFTTQRTYDGAFYLADGGEVSVPLMVNGFAHMGCVRGDGYNAVELTYGASRNAAMLILLPDAGTFHDFESTLDADLFRDVLAGLGITNMLTFTMPRFEFESEANLQETLSALGMTASFGGEADFSGISSGGLFVDYAAHKATISVDEQGTEATGVTSVSMAMSGVMSQCGTDLTADRPFIFTIYNSRTGAILFMGRVMNPAA